MDFVEPPVENQVYYTNIHYRTYALNDTHRKLIVKKGEDQTNWVLHAMIKCLYILCMILKIQQNVMYLIFTNTSQIVWRYSMHQLMLQVHLPKPIPYNYTQLVKWNNKSWCFFFHILVFCVNICAIHGRFEWHNNHM